MLFLLSIVVHSVIFNAINILLVLIYFILLQDASFSQCIFHSFIRNAIIFPLKSAGTGRMLETKTRIARKANLQRYREL